MSKEKEARNPKATADGKALNAQAQNLYEPKAQSSIPHNSKKEGLGPNTKRG